jgi:hypothetical protein
MNHKVFSNKVVKTLYTPTFIFLYNLYIGGVATPTYFLPTVLPSYRPTVLPIAELAETMAIRSLGETSATPYSSARFVIRVRRGFGVDSKESYKFYLI